MIRVGLGHRDKLREIKQYVSNYDINKIYCFYGKVFCEEFNTGIPVEYIEYDQTELYKYFYRLIEEIDDKSLIVVNEMMRTQDRSQLKYNCTHHYINQTPHKIIFEYFPFIDNKDDFMILLDMENKIKFKGKPFDYGYLNAEDIKVKPRRIYFEHINVDITAEEQKKYDQKRDKMFNDLGNKEPDTVYRGLQLFAGDLKKRVINPNKIYIARNKRHKLSNVISYQDKIEKRNDYIVIDTHYRRIDFNDFLKKSGVNRIRYLCTPLNVDNYIANDMIKWIARLEAVYAKSNIYK